MGMEAAEREFESWLNPRGCAHRLSLPPPTALILDFIKTKVSRILDKSQEVFTAQLPGTTPSSLRAHVLSQGPDGWMKGWTDGWQEFRLTSRPHLTTLPPLPPKSCVKASPQPTFSSIDRCSSGRYCSSLKHNTRHDSWKWILPCIFLEVNVLWLSCLR